MKADIRRIGGHDHVLGNTRQAKHILNLRFRLENIIWFPENTYAKSGNPLFRLNRYTLTEIRDNKSEPESKIAYRKGVKEPHIILDFIREAIGPVKCTPQHAHIQAKLIKELRSELCNATITCEENFIDVMAKLPNEIRLFENLGSSPFIVGCRVKML